MPQKDRAERMVDFGLEETKITFDLGDDPTDEEVKEAEQFIDALPEDDDEDEKEEDK